MNPIRFELIRRFERRHIFNHIVMLVCFLGLVATGLPQKWPEQPWAKGIVLIIGGVERTRILHHFLGSIMAIQLVWHVLESLWIHVVRRLPMPMIPRVKDIKDFMQQVRFNLAVDREPPRMGRYTFAEKLEYLALVWGTVLMVATGLILLFPIRWSAFMTGEMIIAAKAAHGGEALLALLSILTWHFYFVHLRHWNKSIFTGYLEEDAYAEEHPEELAVIREGGVPKAPISAVRLAVFGVLALVVVAASVALVVWLRTGTIMLHTVSRL